MPQGGTITPASLITGVGQHGNPVFSGAAIWPTANTAYYVAFYIDTTVTAYQMAIQVAVQSGNLDVGIYDSLGTRLVSKGSTAVAAAGIQVVDIADTTLTPGTYFMAMCCDNITASFRRWSTPDIQTLRCCGVQEQAVGAVTLPNPATFANPLVAYVPGLAIATQATM